MLVSLKKIFYVLGVTIGANSVVRQAIICDRAVVEENAIVNRGCIISYGVELPAYSRLEPFSRLTTSNSLDKVNGCVRTFSVLITYISLLQNENNNVAWIPEDGTHFVLTTLHYHVKHTIFTRR